MLRFIGWWVKKIKTFIPKTSFTFILWPFNFYIVTHLEQSHKVLRWCASNLSLRQTCCCNHFILYFIFYILHSEGWLSYTFTRDYLFSNHIKQVFVADLLDFCGKGPLSYRGEIDRGEIGEWEGVNMCSWGFSLVQVMYLRSRTCELSILSQSTDHFRYWVHILSQSTDHFRYWVHFHDTEVSSAYEKQRNVWNWGFSTE